MVLRLLGFIGQHTLFLSWRIKVQLPPFVFQVRYQKSDTKSSYPLSPGLQKRSNILIPKRQKEHILRIKKYSSQEIMGEE
jgi:hypothetical protein